MGPCMCGATDCPSCGPAQGYTVRKVRKWDGYRFVTTFVNPEDEEADTIVIDNDDDYYIEDYGDEF